MSKESYLSWPIISVELAGICGGVCDNSAPPYSNDDASSLDDALKWWIRDLDLYGLMERNPLLWSLVVLLAIIVKSDYFSAPPYSNDDASSLDDALKLWIRDLGLYGLMERNPLLWSLVVLLAIIIKSDYFSGSKWTN